MFFYLKYGRVETIFIWKGLIAKPLYACKDRTSETICLEITMDKKKWCVTFACRPQYNSNKDGLINL